MSELRRARFETLDSIGTEDLSLVCEIWMDDLIRAPWAAREAMKLGSYFVRYMLEPQTTQLTLSAMEAIVQLTREDVRRSLALLQSFRAINSFAMERDGITVELRLSLLQQIRVLETRALLERLTTERAAQLGAIAAQHLRTPALASLVATDGAAVEAPKAA